MDKKLVLEVFAKSLFRLTPDHLHSICMEKYARTSVYAYLLRLKRQKLLYRDDLGKRIAYRITKQGMERLEYFKRRGK
jgi:DNA-binding PadR family transcriptional regulator